jgi:periplasmic divalent cation tolerance protein
VSGTLHEIGGTDRGLRVVYCGFPDADTARRIGDAAVDRRLAACVNRFPIESTYHWKGTIERTSEVVALFKTSPRKVGALFAFLAREHPYEVPDIFELPVVRVHRPYLDYLVDTLEPRFRPPRLHARGAMRPRRPGSRPAPGARALRRTRARHHRPSRRTGMRR